MQAGTARLHLERLGEPVASGHDWLTEDERQRLQGMSSPARRRAFLAGHWMARKIAAGWLQVDVRRIALDRHADGRPMLRVDGDASPLSVSLSHSGDWLAVALAPTPVGVDVELPRRARDYARLASYAFSAVEVARLRGLRDDEHVHAFHELWTLKEAQGKRSGVGVLPGRSRLSASVPGEPGAIDAFTWRIRDGALALAMDTALDLVVTGLADVAEKRAWRFVDAGAAMA